MRENWKSLALRGGVLLLLMLFAAGCRRGGDGALQGYIEGDFVYVASPLAGALKELAVEKGAIVKSNQPLFALDNISEQAARDEAERRLAQARANLEDAKKSRRPTEIKSMESQLEEARAALDLAGKEWERQKTLFQEGVGTASDRDRAQSTRDQAANRVKTLESDLDTAQLGARSDQVAAAEEEVRAREAALAGAEWNLSQKQQVAPKAGLVFDTLYRQGEWVGAGKPVVVLLPPQNVKLRVFVPEQMVGGVHAGDAVTVSVDGASSPFPAKVSYISAAAEYTPPVIYSKENRAKLMFMVEAVFAPADAALMHPGQPVDVRFNH